MKNRLSRKSSEELAKLTLQDVYEMGYEDGKNFHIEGAVSKMVQAIGKFKPTAASSVEDQTIEHEGKLLRKVNCEARVGDYVRFPGINAHFTKGDKFYEVIQGNFYKDDEDDKMHIHCWSRCPNPEVFEVVSDSPPQIEKSANQQRAELIEKAKRFVEVKTESLKDSSEVKGGYAFKKKENPNFCSFITNVEFVVDKGKRTVIALLRYSGERKVTSKGIAKCAPDDVFNEHIGKAITLARALNIDIPVEFLEAVQPDEFVVGQLIEANYDDAAWEPFEISVIRNKTNVKSELWDLNDNCFITSDLAKIIDDTNVQYEVS